jgi:hypothetical protein
MLYEDEQWHHLMVMNNNKDDNNTDPMVTLLPQDLETASFVLWMGISFHQQASCQYFQKVWDAGGHRLIHYLINPKAVQALENLETVLVMTGETEQQRQRRRLADQVLPVEITSDNLFAQLLADPIATNSPTTR